MEHHGEERLPAKALLELLPPIEDAPILEHLARVGLDRFQEQYAIPVPQSEEGLIDHEQFISILTGLVTNPNFRWKGSVYNKHHLFFYKRFYRPITRGEDDVDDYPYRFRELTIHKLWEPKQLHIFGHAVLGVPFVPHLDVMHRVVDEYEANNKVYDMVNNAIRIENTPYRSRSMHRRLGRIYRHLESCLETDDYSHLHSIIGSRAVRDSLYDLQPVLTDRLGRKETRNNSILVRVSTE